jgi:hypothetical protein
MSDLAVNISVMAFMWLVMVFAMCSIVIMLHRNHQAMNSRLTELLIVTKALARAEGYKAGQEDNIEALRRVSESLDHELPNGG